jgi:hypothetical protein
MTTREIAESLFKPMREADKGHLVEAASTAPKTVRVPRILGAKVRRDPVPSAEHALEQPLRTTTDQFAGISVSEHGRIRTLATYGMTIKQVAAHYEVSEAVIERILGR